ncbi:histidine kinase [Streptomyces sp. NPDC093510]|uniref:histidine kinase n=1 Tax=Streptomyces sp. NPDC093510 TaxID=3155199 RepID=UPI0034257F65
MSLWVVHVQLLGGGPAARLLPAAMRSVRRLADRQRELAGEWSGRDFSAPYPDLPATGQGLALRAQLAGKQGQVWRDRRWVGLDPCLGGMIAFGPLALLLSGVWGLFTAAFGVRLSQEWDSVWYLFVPVQNWPTAVLAGVLGALQFPLAFFWAAPRAVRMHERYLRAMLAPSESELRAEMAEMAHRIDHLTTTRTAAVDTQMAEIRRIERDLHDGAQVRLVAMGMTLDAAEHLLESNPEAVRALLVEARENSTKALQELRDLVRGIHPPVLADRGLADAVRSLAMLSPLATEVTAELPARLDPPVESAAYFAVSEIMANAAKHSGAERAWIDIRHETGTAARSSGTAARTCGATRGNSGTAPDADATAPGSSGTAAHTSRTTADATRTAPDTSRTTTTDPTRTTPDTSRTTTTDPTRTTPDTSRTTTTDPTGTAPGSRGGTAAGSGADPAPEGPGSGADPAPDGRGSGADPAPEGRGTLRITVTDDGHGGADASLGSGLRGIEQRLATFDGVLAMSSPPGGPTLVTLEVPCALSSPKTTSC